MKDDKQVEAGMATTQYSSDEAASKIKAAVEEAVSLITVVAGSIEDTTIAKVLLTDSKALWYATWGGDCYSPEVVTDVIKRALEIISKTQLWRTPLEGLLQLVRQDREVTHEQ